MKTQITDRIEYLVSTFLNEGLNVEEKNELKIALQQKHVRDYFMECYQVWNITSQNNINTTTDLAFKK